MNEVTVDGADLAKGFKELGRLRFREDDRLDVRCTDNMLWFGALPMGFGVRFEGTWDAAFTVRAKSLKPLRDPKAFAARPVKVRFDGSLLHLDLFQFPTRPIEDIQ